MKEGKRCYAVISLAVVIERGWFWWRLRSSAEADQMLELAAAGNWEGALRRRKENKRNAHIHA